MTLLQEEGVSLSFETATDGLRKGEIADSQWLCAVLKYCTVILDASPLKSGHPRMEKTLLEMCH